MQRKAQLVIVYIAQFSIAELKRKKKASHPYFIENHLEKFFTVNSVRHLRAKKI